MMLIVPHGAELGLGRRSYVTYAIVILCILIHIMQDNNRDKISLATEKYCESIYQPDENLNKLDILSLERYECEAILRVRHGDRDGEMKELINEWITKDYSGFNESEQIEIMALVDRHYEAFSLNTPASLDVKLMYYPDTWNPFTSITSTLSHGDWWHIIGNLLFFMAFAPAIEILIGNRLKYIGFLLAISFVTSISYSLVTIMGSPIPTLGLSGVVMGMIGMSGFLMPHVRIRVFVWFITFMKNIYIRAWILALWYIGWDIWDMFTDDGGSGVNFVAHVSGGISGYLLGYFFLKERRDEIHEELHDEIEYSKSQRVDGGNFSTHVGVSSRIVNQETERAAIKEQAEILAKLHKYIRERKNSTAIVFMLEHYEVVPSNAELYEELFQNMHEWGESRALMCAGRATIHLLLSSNMTPRALVITERCHKIDENFCLADPQSVLGLAKAARDQQRYQAAYLLVKQVGMRYELGIDVVACKLLETELLWHHLNHEDEARHQMKILLNMNSPHEKDAILRLASFMKRDA